MWRACVLTLYPDMFPGPLGGSLAGRARDNELWALECVNIREYATDKHRTVDATPAGGGPGMVMRADIVAAALDGVISRDDQRARIYLSPRGLPLTQSLVRDLAGGPGVVLLCGRFEGVDERVIEARSFMEVSIGDFVLSGGEIAAMALIEAVVRLLPGVIGNEASHVQESFEGALLEYPHYTRPRQWEGLEIPPILQSGDHGRIEKWRRSEAERATKARRPDLWRRYKKGRVQEILPHGDKGSEKKLP